MEVENIGHTYFIRLLLDHFANGGAFIEYSFFGYLWGIIKGSTIESIVKMTSTRVEC